ncbi:hypothetical protein ACQR1I_23185 [Bradyrhizobium sp. HKCCYLS2038]|uniref:hypothetical protein n=1 Tax=unclassified Bradyrhizobium TaxID=2631580 RepID=UPI003EBBB661
MTTVIVDKSRHCDVVIGWQLPMKSRRATLPIRFSVMPGLVPGIHVGPRMPNGVDGRDKPGHDGVETGEHNAQIIVRDCPRSWQAAMAGKPQLKISDK